MVRTPGLGESLLQPNLFESLEKFRQECLIKEAFPLRTCFVVSLVDRPGDYIGVNWLQKPDVRVRKVEFMMGVYSDKLRNTAASTEAFYLIMRHVFEELGYDKLVATALPDSKQGFRTLERMGFAFEQLSRNGLMLGGVSHDVTEWVVS